MPFTDNNESQLSWGWFLSAGIVLMLLGAICIIGSAAATFITVSILGWVLLISAVIAVVQAIRAPDWTGFLVYVLSALFRGFTGYLLVRYPITGELGLTFLLAALFVIGGFFRAIAAGTMRFPYWGWSVVSGLLSVMLGVVVLTGAPALSSWFIGFFIGIDLLMDGAAVSAFATALYRSAAIETLERG